MTDEEPKPPFDHDPDEWGDDPKEPLWKQGPAKVAPSVPPRSSPAPSNAPLAPPPGAQPDPSSADDEWGAEPKSPLWGDAPKAPLWGDAPLATAVPAPPQVQAPPAAPVPSSADDEWGAEPKAPVWRAGSVAPPAPPAEPADESLVLGSLASDPFAAEAPRGEPLLRDPLTASAFSDDLIVHEALMPDALERVAARSPSALGDASGPELDSHVRAARISRAPGRGAPSKPPPREPEPTPSEPSSAPKWVMGVAIGAFLLVAAFVLLRWLSRG